MLTTHRLPVCPVCPVCPVWVVLLLSACGSHEEIPSLPVADAGFDRHDLRVGTTVVLDGSGSFDSDNGALEYLWSLAAKPLESNATLRAGKEPEHPSLTVDALGYYLVGLRVSTAFRESDPDLVALEAINVPPVAVAECQLAATCEVLHGTEVTLNANGSYDAEGAALAYQWRQITTAADCATACPAQASCAPSATSVGAIASVAQPVVTLPEVVGDIVFELTVSDGEGTGTDCVVVTAVDTPPDFFSNPERNPAPPAEIHEGEAFTFTCYPRDRDPGDDFTITWTQEEPASPVAELTHADEATVTVLVPEGTITEDTVFELEVTLSDGVETTTATGDGRPVPPVTVLDVP